MNPSVLHLVISLAPGGLERLVVDWTNARNRRLPGSTRIVCLDELGALAGQVEMGEKRTSNIEHSTLNIEQKGAEEKERRTSNIEQKGAKAPDSSRLNVECSMLNVQCSNSPSPVTCVGAHRSRFPCDRSAVRKVVKLLSESPFGYPSTTEQLNNSTTNNRPPPVVLHAHNLSAWQYGVLTKTYWKRMRTLNIEHSTLNVERGGAKAPDRSQLDVECSMFNVQRSNSLPLLRLIYTQHGANVHNMRLRDRFRARLLACFTDEIVAVSDATAAVMAKTMWLSRHRIKVIANGVAVGKPSTQCEAPVVTAVSAVQSPVGREDAAGTAATTEERLLRSKDTLSGRGKIGIPADAFVMGSVGRLAHVKGQDRLIAAFAALKSQLLSCQVAELLPAGKVVGCQVDKLPPPEKVVGCQVDKLLGGNPKVSQFSALNNQQPNNPTTLSSCPLTTEQPNNSTEQPNNSTTYLLLTGDGPERANLERQAMDLGIADRVIFAGYQANPEPYLAAMDLFVLPSRSEGVSVALLEAMAAGVPVAVTDVGANREVVDDGLCGVILPEDETHWPEAITALITDPKATTQRTQAAQQRVRTHYSLDATLDGYERLYQNRQNP